MIYRLIRLNFSSWMLGIALAGECFTFALYRYSSSGAAIRGLTIWPLIIALGFIWPRRGTPRYTLFEAALPIHPRSIFSVRILSHVTAIWVTFLTVLAAILTSPHKTGAGISVFVLDVGAVLTLGVIAIHSIRAEETRPPRWWGVVVGVAIWVAVSVMDGPARVASVPSSLAIGVFAICMLGSAALFWSTWASIPESFQMAPEGAVAQKSQGRKVWLPSFAWLPVLRRFFTAGPAIFILVLALDGATGLKSSGLQLFAIVLSWLSIWGTILIVRTRDRWLLSLPISRQWIFLAIVLAPLGILTLSPLGLSQRPVRVEIISWMVVAAASLLPGFFVRIPTLAERYRAAWVYMRIFVMLLTIGVLIWWGVAAVTGSGTMPIESWLAKIMPVRLPLLIATAVAVVGASYWLACKGFCRMEVWPRRLRYQGDQ